MFLISILVTTISAFAEGISIPSLKQHIYVYDNQNIIDDTTESSVNKMLEELENKTKSEFFIVTIESLNEMTIESYANQLFNKIGIGKKEEDNGLLLLIYKDATLEESKVRIEVGDGFQGFITDSISGRVLDNYFVPYREEDKYSEATKKTAEVLTTLIAKEYEVSISGVALSDEEINAVTEEPDYSWILWLIPIIIFGIILDFKFTGGDITMIILDCLLSGSGGSSGGRSGGGGHTSGGGASR